MTRRVIGSPVTDLYSVIKQSSLPLCFLYVFFHLSFFPLTVVVSAEPVQEDRVLSQIAPGGSG